MSGHRRLGLAFPRLDLVGGQLNLVTVVRSKLHEGQTVLIIGQQGGGRRRWDRAAVEIEWGGVAAAAGQ